MAQRYKFSIESKSFPLDISGEPVKSYLSMANIELLAEITASGMYIFDYFTKVFFGITH